MDEKRGLGLEEAFRMSAFWMLDEQGEPIPAQDGRVWSEWQTKEHCQLAEAFLGEIRVSTVFLGMPHVSKEIGNKQAMFFETMVFAENATLQRLADLSETDDRGIIALMLSGLGSEVPEIQKRYATRGEALEGHARLCTFIGVCMVKGLLP